MKRAVVFVAGALMMLAYVPLAFVEGVSRHFLDCMDTALWKMKRWEQR